MLRRTVPLGRKLRVGIVGAGVAGLRAADCLIRHGVDVTVYEARDRIGGRVAQSDLGGDLVDLGANWIHGTVNNPILELARRTNTQVHCLHERQTVFDTDGSRISDEEALETAENFWGMVSEISRYSRENCKNIPAGESLSDMIEKKAEERFKDLSEEVAKRKTRLLLHESLIWGSFVAGETKRQSLKFFWLEDGPEGDTPFAAGTYERILKMIARPALEGATMEMETEIAKVHYDGSEDQVKVVTVGGESEVFDEVVVTCPLGYLKRNKHMFEPNLPERMSEAIDAIGYGQLDKVYIRFPSAFWNQPQETTETPNGTHRNSDTVAPLPQHSANMTSALPKVTSSADHFSGSMHFYPPTYAPTTNPRAWNQQAINLASLPTASAHPSLLFYISGPCALALSKLSSLPAADAKRRLTDFFMPYIALLPHYSASDPACNPSHVLSTNWAADRLAGHGSYSNFHVGLEHGDADIECLRRGLPERRTWIAGEAVAPFIALGTTTGAYRAGEGVAERIMRVYGIGS